MQKWEYCTVRLAYGGREDAVSIVHLSLNGQSWADPAVAELRKPRPDGSLLSRPAHWVAVLNILGEEGWEVVAADWSHPAEPVWSGLFKRPAEPGRPAV